MCGVIFEIFHSCSSLILCGSMVSVHRSSSCSNKQTKLHSSKLIFVHHWKAMEFSWSILETRFGELVDAAAWEFKGRANVWLTWANCDAIFECSSWYCFLVLRLSWWSCAIRSLHRLSKSSAFVLTCFDCTSSSSINFRQAWNIWLPTHS